MIRQKFEHSFIHTFIEKKDAEEVFEILFSSGRGSSPLTHFFVLFYFYARIIMGSSGEEFEQPCTGDSRGESAIKGGGEEEKRGIIWETWIGGEGCCCRWF